MIMEDIIVRVKNFVEQQCKKPESSYGYEPFIFHFIPVVEYAEKLAEELDGNREIILIAAWLHDIGSIIHGRKDHHLTGAKIAGEKLLEFGYPKDRIEKVKKCILNHRGSMNNIQESIEEKIISDADAMSHFENISGLFKASFIYENLTQKEAQDSVREKLENKWKRLNFEKSKDIIRPKYEAAMLLLK